MKALEPPAGLAGEDGLTLVEVLVAMTVLVIGGLAVIGPFNAARRLSTNAEMRASATAIGQGEIERLESLPWASIALATSPAANSDGGTVNDPTHYISTGPCWTWTGSIAPVTLPYGCYQWNWQKPATASPLVINSATSDTTANPNTVTDPISVSNSSTRVKFSVYRFIMYVNDSTGCTAKACLSNYYKRITVAVASSRLAQPIVLTTMVTNPIGGSQSPLPVTGVDCLDGTSTVSCTQ